MVDRQVILVCGPPCAGKTTYVQQHAKPGDLILDQDRIGPADMAQGIDQVAHMNQGRAWIIRCCPGVDNRAHLAAQLRADDIILLRPDNDTLFRRARSRKNPGGQVLAVRSWLEQEAGGGRAPTRDRAGDPRPRRATRW